MTSRWSLIWRNRFGIFSLLWKRQSSKGLQQKPCMARLLTNCAVYARRNLLVTDIEAAQQASMLWVPCVSL